MKKKLLVYFALAFTGFPDAAHSSSSAKSPAKSNPKIAVVGAGIGGASATSFLTELFKEHGIEADIDVYEKQHVGGRLSLSELDGHYYEMGGSAIHPKNKYMEQFVKDLDLSKRHVFGVRLGLYDGKQYVLMDSDRSISSFGKLFHRYGNSISSWHNIIDDVMKRFVRIYDIQDEGRAFTSVEKLLEAIDPLMLNLTKTTTKEYLLGEKLLPVFVNEIVMSIIRIAYGQTPDVNAFVGTMSLAAAKAGLWGVRGGNEQVPQLLIKKCNAKVIMRKVTNIVLPQNANTTGTSTFEVHSVPAPLTAVNASSIRNRDVQPDEIAVMTKTYDMVIVATPLNRELSGISLNGFPAERFQQPTSSRYHQTVTTLVNGVLNTDYLEAGHQESSLDEILTTVEGSLFNSLTRVYPVDVDEEVTAATSVWKVSSERIIGHEDMNKMFRERRASTATHWLAYPAYRPAKLLGPFLLYPGLFYTSSIDWAASSIEMSAISGRNAALLAFYHWTKKSSSHFVDSSHGAYKDEL